MRTTGRAKVTANKRVSVQMLGGINQGGEDRMRSLNIPPTALCPRRSSRLIRVMK